MSALPVVAAGTATSWRCKACAATNTQTVRAASSAVSVPCTSCGAFNNVSAAPAPAPTASAPSSGAQQVTAGAPSAVGSSSIPVVTSKTPLSLDDDARVARFQTLLRMQTVANQGPTNGANAEAVAYLKSIGESMGLRSAVHEYAPGRPILVLTLPGTDPSLPSLLLNSHYDVVPVFRESWKCDPFAAEIDADGKIYGRGTQDMKCVCMAYLEAMLSLLRGTADRARVSSFTRTVHLSYMPDEETGGEFGMQQWVETAEFRALNVGFALDEGIANPKDEYTVFYGERGVWWMTVTAQGPTGHGSRFIQNPATQKLHRVIQYFLDFRALQEKKLLDAQEKQHPAQCAHARAKALELGDVISVNLTVLKAGVTTDNGKTYSYNVVPMEASAGFDLRLPPHVDLKEFEALVKSWTDTEEGVTFATRKFSAEWVTEIHDGAKNPFWVAFQSALGEVSGSTKVVPQIFPAGTDSRFLRRALIPVIGFSPLNLTPVLLHDHNEFIGRDTFLKGIKVYETLIPALANLQAQEFKNEHAVYLQKKQPLDKLPKMERKPVQEDAEESSSGLAPGSAGAVPTTSSSAATAASSQTEQLHAPSPIPTQTDAAGSAATTQTDAAATAATTQTETQA